MPEPSTTSFRWLRSGSDAFPVMLEAIDAARRSVRLEMYIYSSEEPGGQFRDAMVRALHRGVMVWVLLDALGSFRLPASFWKPLTDAGGTFRWFNPLKLGRLSFRDHRKMLVCDEEVAFVGGLNVAPEYLGDGVASGWCDLGLEIRGKLAAELGEAFDGSMARAGFEHTALQRFRKATARGVRSAETWRLLLSGPGRGYNYLKGTLATDLARAQDVQIICAYFLPTWRLRWELERVARRGGRVQLILAGKSDVRISQLATRRLYRSLFKRQVEIFEYQPQVLHAKLFIIDGQVFVGSCNLDARSLNINYELLVRITDPEVVRGAREIFQQVLRHSRQVEPGQWSRSRNFWTKLMEQVAYFFLARVDPWWARLRGRPPQ